MPNTSAAKFAEVPAALADAQVRQQRTLSPGKAAPQRHPSPRARTHAPQASLGPRHRLTLLLLVERVKQLREVQQRRPAAERDFSEAVALYDGAREVVAEVLGDVPDGAQKLEENRALVHFFAGELAAADAAYAALLQQVRGRKGGWRGGGASGHHPSLAASLVRTQSQARFGETHQATLFIIHGYSYVLRELGAHARALPLNRLQVRGCRTLRRH